MEAKNLYVLSGTEDFMQGELDNVTIQNGCIVLDSVAGRHVLYGCYTTPPISMPEFDAMIMSWNVDTPEKTVVEANARVMVDGNWTTWSSFGKWSPYLPGRANAKRPPRGPVSVLRNIFRLDSKTAIQVQLRIYLYTEDELRTPAVSLLAASVHPVNFSLYSGFGRPIQRVLRVPAYSQQLRAPSFGGAASLPICIVGMMNRWGEDALPEELAHAMYDWGDRTCANVPFAVAAAGCWGYECYTLWTDLNHLREEIRSGHSAAVQLSWPNADEGYRVPPAIQAVGEEQGHYVLVTGFVTENDIDYVLVNDPMAPGNDCVSTRWRLSYFMKVWDGLTILLHRRRGEPLPGKPLRIAATLRPSKEDPNLYHLYVRGEKTLLPTDFCGPVGVPKGTLALVRSGSLVHATTAHKYFRYIQPRFGGVVLPAPGGSVRRYEVFAIDGSGRTIAAEVRI